MSLTTFSGPVQSLNGFIGGTFTGPVVIAGNADITGNLSTDGTLVVDGASTLTGAVVASSTLAVTGAVTSAAAKTDYSAFRSTPLLATVGTWTQTYIAEGNHVLRHSAAADISVLVFDITEAIRTASSKGFSLTSIDVVYSIGTANLTAHTATLDKVSYANNSAVTITSAPLTGSLATATQAQPYVSNLAVTTPAFNNTADSKLVFEVTVNAATTSAYDMYGINLKFSRNDL